MTEQFDTFNDLYRAVLVSDIHIVYSFDSRFSCKTSPHPCCLNVVAHPATGGAGRSSGHLMVYIRVYIEFYIIYIYTCNYVYIYVYIYIAI